MSHPPWRVTDKMMDALFQVGWKKGELDFSVRGDLATLSLDEMNSFRAMLVAGIGTAEDMWRREQENKHPAAQTHRKET